MGSISSHITPLVDNSLRITHTCTHTRTHIHTCTHTHTYTDICTEKILRNQAAPAYGQHAPGLKSDSLLQINNSCTRRLIESTKANFGTLISSYKKLLYKYCINSISYKNEFYKPQKIVKNDHLNLFHLWYVDYAYVSRMY